MHQALSSFLRKAIPLPTRVIMAIMGFLGVVNAYTMRICLSVAITEMVRKKNISEHANLEDMCHFDDDTKNSTSSTADVEGLFDWSEEIQGVILSSFYWGYILTHVPGGLLAEKFGGKYVLSLGILSTALFTLITPWTIDAGGAPVLIALRILEGLGEGTTFPALNALLAMWIPLKERSKLGALVFGGAQVGTILGNSLSGLVIDAFDDWRAVFYFFGICGIIWFIFFSLLCSSDPQSHPFITEKEKAYLTRELGQLERNKNLPPTPWKSIVTNKAMIALVIAQIGHDFGFFVMVTDLPKYMSDVLKFNIKENGLYSALPYVLMWIISLASGAIGDYTIKNGHQSVTNSRKMFTTIASFGPSVFIVAASYAECDRTLAVVFFVLAMGCMGTYYAGMKINALDLSPNYAGTLMAITNGIAATTGIIGPYLVGLITTNSYISEWRTVFWIAFAIFNATNLVYLLWASGEVQSFNSPEQLEKSAIVESQIAIPLPTRIVLSIMGFFAVLNAYTMRICLSVAITEMVLKKNVTAKENSDDMCHFDEDMKYSISNANIEGRFDWSEEIQGVILSAFYWGYIITHLPGGLLAEKFGGKYVLSLGILSTALFTLITPWTIDAGGAPVLIALRILEGLGEGTTFPALNALLAMWIPLKERSKMGALVFGGAQVGTILGNLLSGLIIDAFGDWRTVFYFFGACGILWFIFFSLLCFSDPESHPFITEQEKAYLTRELGQLERKKNLPPTPWKLIVTNKAMIALLMAQIGHDFGFYVMVSDLPKYMSDVLKFNIKDNGVYSALPYVLMWIISLASGAIGDYTIKHGYQSVTNSRKLFTTIASFGPSIFIVAASYAGCDRTLAVTFFILAMGSMGTYYGGMKVNSLDLSPNYAGTLMAITNGIGAITGIIGPYIVGVITTNSYISEWRIVFWITFAIFNITNIVYLLWASGEIQPFNTPDQLEKSVIDEHQIDEKPKVAEKRYEMSLHH